MTAEFFAITFISACVMVMCYVVCSRRFTLPWLFEAGMSLMALGFLTVIDALLTRPAFNINVAAARWILIAGGALLMIISIAWRRAGRGYRRRISDIIKVKDIHQ